jgi:hypothetical protein
LSQGDSNGAIMDELYTYHGLIMISTYRRCRRRPQWGCQQISPRGPSRAIPAGIATHLTMAITD